MDNISDFVSESKTKLTGWSVSPSKRALKQTIRVAGAYDRYDQIDWVFI
ncbi:hypothetical protein [Alkalibacterium subtropicum]|nr:hypothetical protein [Alkalibacterium subtropicum]